MPKSTFSCKSISRNSGPPMTGHLGNRLRLRVSKSPAADAISAAPYARCLVYNAERGRPHPSFSRQRGNCHPDRPSARYELLARVLPIIHVALFAILVVCIPSPADSGSLGLQPNDPRDDRSPWGVGTGAEWFSAYPVFNPMLKQAGVRWLRGFYEWQTVQPKQGHWNFALPDRLVENARANGIHLTGSFGLLAPWASADGGTRRFPIKNIQFWRDYVRGVVERYHSNI